MRLKIRMQVGGRKGQRSYPIVVAPISAPRNGSHIARIGYYQPWNKDCIGSLDVELLNHWISKGAVPTDATAKVLAKLNPEKCGHLYKKPEPGKYHKLKKADVKKLRDEKKSLVSEQKKKAAEALKKKKENKKAEAQAKEEAKKSDSSAQDSADSNSPSNSESSK